MVQAVVKHAPSDLHLKPPELLQHWGETIHHLPHSIGQAHMHLKLNDYICIPLPSQELKHIGCLWNTQKITNFLFDVADPFKIQLGHPGLQTHQQRKETLCVLNRLENRVTYREL